MIAIGGSFDGQNVSPAPAVAPLMRTATKDCELRYLESTDEQRKNFQWEEEIYVAAFVQGCWYWIFVKKVRKK